VTVEAALLSLESSIIEVLGIGAPGTTPNQRRKPRQAGEVRSGSKSVANTDWGYMGTRESLTSPHDRWSIREHHSQNSLSLKVNTGTLKGAKKSSVSQAVSRPRETEGKEKGEGSLSILVVLIDIWGINPRNPD